VAGSATTNWIHLPRYLEDTNVDAVREAVGKYGITESLAIDNEHKLRDSFQNEKGYVRPPITCSTNSTN